MMADLIGELDVGVMEDGSPEVPLVVLSLDELAGVPPNLIERAAARMKLALPLVVGVLRGPVSLQIAPLLDALTVTITDAPQEDTPRQMVAVDDVDKALGVLRLAVSGSPRAAISCGQLLRQAERLPTLAGLSAEAAAYSMLLNGPEFTRWLGERGKPREVAFPDRPLVGLNREGARLTVVLDHPERRNALSRRLREDLLEAVLLVEMDDSIAEVEISGAGPAFCSGGDLDEFGTATDLVAAYLVRLDRAPWRVIDRIRDRVTVRVHGPTIGAGAEMAAFAGTVIASPGAYFSFPEIRMGLVPGAGGTVSMTRRVGRWRAAWLMLTEHKLSSETALAWGLVDEVDGEGT
ncbi:enoyl-CoA hydratase/isomerase family protein [Nocardia sp. NPDC052278]|uniref:enoyl-CoA hydratase/isomerase family protein n=1 Tax=unclassified Nocardia TaxID=2637762 RepID=UPI00369B5C28